MQFRQRRILVRVVVGVALFGAVVLAPPLADGVGAHGSTQSPPSRYYTCRFLDRDNPMCAAAWAANPQALYDWMEVNLGDAGGRHRELIPDGQLCSAGRGKYGAFDQPGSWPVTALRLDGSGMVDLVYENTAPHATAYYQVYITGPGFDARTQAVGWGDLELVYDSGPMAATSVAGLRVPLPERAAPAVLYVVWQRSDSPEAFYACSDVTVAALGADAVTSPSVQPASGPAPSAPTSTSPPAPVVPADGAGLQDGRVGAGTVPEPPAGGAAPAAASPSPSPAPTSAPANGLDGAPVSPPGSVGASLSSEADLVPAVPGAVVVVDQPWPQDGLAIEGSEALPAMFGGTRLPGSSDPGSPTIDRNRGWGPGLGLASTVLVTVGALVVFGLGVRWSDRVVGLFDGLRDRVAVGSHYPPPRR